MLLNKLGKYLTIIFWLIPPIVFIVFVGTFAQNLIVLDDYNMIGNPFVGYLEADSFGGTIKAIFSQQNEYRFPILSSLSIIQYNFSKKLKRLDRKVKQGNFQVLRETIMPSVLVELGFLTNKREGRYLNSSKGQQQMGKSISDAVLNYVNHLKLNTVVEQDAVFKEIVEYKIQISSGKNKIPTKSYNFKGLKNIQRVKVGAYYKYYYGVTSSYNNVVKSLKTAKVKGYKTAFIVAFKNGEKVSVKEVNK